MATAPRTRDLFGELDTLTTKETHVLDELLERGAALELAELARRSLHVADLHTLGDALTAFSHAVGDLQARIAAAELAAATNGGGPPTVQALTASIHALEAESGRLRAQLRDRLAALDPSMLSEPAPAPAPAPPAGAPRTFRVTTPALRGTDVKAFQRVLNARFAAWGIASRIAEDGEYGVETRNAARHVAIGLGLAKADILHGITPAVRTVIRTPSRRSAPEIERAAKRRPWLRKLRAARAKTAHRAAPAKHRRGATPPAQPGTAGTARVPADAAALAAAIRAGGGRYEDIIVREARRAKVAVSLVCAVVEQESDFRNVFGHDDVRNPVKSPRGGVLEVTEGRYRDYLRHRRLGHGNQGVGPMQLTFPAFQDRADDLGGCWRPAANIRVGVGVLADNIRAVGLERGVQRYNGAKGNAYAKSVLGLEAKWRARLAEAATAAAPPAHHDAPAAAPPAAGLRALHRGARSEAARALQTAVKTRLATRHQREMADGVDVDGVIGRKTMEAVTTAAWLLGAQRSTLRKMNATGEITVGIQRLIRNPGMRTDAQKALGKKRVAHARTDRHRRAAGAPASGSPRERIVKLAQQAAANYRANPGAYHYFAGGVANTEFLMPTPHGWRSDCSQFVASVYKAARLPSPANVDHKWASTYSMVKKGRVTAHPKPGDLGMYGSRSAPHHVELYCGAPGGEFVGHGSPPIDSLTPGRPDFYLTYDFLD